VALTELFDEKVHDAHFGWQLRDYYGMVGVEVLDAFAAEGLTTSRGIRRVFRAS
jgi:hypothetical protein